MAVHKSRRSILSLKSWLFTPATKADRFGRAAEVCLPRRNVLHRLPVCDQGRQDQQGCPSAFRSCHDTSHSVHYVVTENGLTNLKGLSSRERAQALIALAHPDFQEGLTAVAEEMHLL